MADEHFAVAGVFEDASVRCSLPWNVVQAIFFEQLLCDLLEVADEILFSDIMRHSRENMVVADIHERKDLVYLEHDFKES